MNGISVVIPSLGGDLCTTLDSLNSGSIVPNEIIVCLPNDSHSVQNLFRYKNVSVVYAKRYGQVYQRIIGFKSAKYDYIVQLDDDILLSFDCLHKLVESFKVLPENSAIAPTFLIKESNTKPKKIEEMSTFKRILYWVANGKEGFQPGRISSSGFHFDLDFSGSTKSINKSEWLMGGCVLHKKNNLILKDYFPFDGKAFSEDLIHSYLLRERGIGLYVRNDIVAYIDDDLDSVNSLAKLIQRYKVTNYAADLQRRNSIRLKIYYLIKLIRLYLK